MRCPIRRLTSRRVSPAKPRMARDSVETHARTSRRAGDHPLRKPPRRADGRWHPRRPPERQCSGRSSCGSRPHEKPRHGGSGGGGMRLRSPRLQRGLTLPREPKCRRGDASIRGEVGTGGEVGASAGATEVTGPGRDQEAALLQFGGN